MATAALILDRHSRVVFKLFNITLLTIVLFVFPFTTLILASILARAIGTTLAYASHVALVDVVIVDSKFGRELATQFTVATQLTKSVPQTMTCGCVLLATNTLSKLLTTVTARMEDTPFGALHGEQLLRTVVAPLLA